MMARLVASFLGTGLLLRRFRGADEGSGTIAGLVALGIAFLVQPWWGRLLALVICLLAGLWAIRSIQVGDDDPGWVAIDEAAGTFLATLGLALPGALVAFVVFRAADIAKRFFPGVAEAERIGGRVGIMADDFVAGLYGLTAGWVVQMLLG
ncbi:MAG: phosphatidylglycerophosphatase A [Acidimicrobiia bacterium]